MKYDFRRLLQEEILDSVMYHCDAFLWAMRKGGKNLRISGHTAENEPGYH